MTLEGANERANDLNSFVLAAMILGTPTGVASWVCGGVVEGGICHVMDLNVVIACIGGEAGG